MVVAGRSRERRPIDPLLFSGGGNDIVGENDFERFLRAESDSAPPRRFMRLPRLRRKVKQIGLAYEELLDIRDHFSPETLVMTHCYDYPSPSLPGAELLGGLIKSRGWMTRFTDEMANVLRSIAAEREGFVVVDTRGTLSEPDRWLNEIHPTDDGFAAVAEPIFRALRDAFPVLQA